MKTALVTGVSRGIGEQVACALLSEGWRVFGISRTKPKIDQRHFAWHDADVSYISDMNAVASMFSVAGWHLDAVVHCAARQGPIGPMSENDPDEWWDTIDTNLIGTYNVVRAFLPFLRRTADPRILLFSGGGAFNARMNYSAYAVSKAGVVSLMETLAAELRHEVCVNCVSPGFVPTSIHQPPIQDDGGQRMAEAVACVMHLLSPACTGLTGRTVSAEYDDWRSINQHTIVSVNASTQGTRMRVPIQRVTELVRSTAGVIG